MTKNKPLIFNFIDKSEVEIEIPDYKTLIAIGNVFNIELSKYILKLKYTIDLDGTSYIYLEDNELGKQGLVIDSVKLYSHNLRTLDMTVFNNYNDTKTYIKKTSKGAGFSQKQILIHIITELVKSKLNVE